jgi:hypothetical protein
MRKGFLVVFVAVLVITAMMILNIVRSNMLAAQSTLKTAVVEYSTVSRIYTQSAASEAHAAVLMPLQKPQRF